MRACDWQKYRKTIIQYEMLRVMGVLMATLFIVAAKLSAQEVHGLSESRSCWRSSQNNNLEFCTTAHARQPEGPAAVSGAAVVTPLEILTQSSALWAADAPNRVAANVSWQGKTSDGSRSDLAPNPLFNEIPQQFQTNPLFAKQIALFSIYNRDESVPDPLTPHEWAAIDAFLDEVMKTDVMKQTHAFLASKGLVESDPGLFQDRLWEIWYSQYVRSKALSSSGAEHVQVGETKGSGISGLHNWARFALLEQAGHVNYLGYVRFADLGDGAYLIHNPFFWDKFYKPSGSFFIGTSPAYDMSVFTLCFYARPNSSCRVRAGQGKSHYRIVTIQTFTMTYDGHDLVGSSYPNY